MTEGTPLRFDLPAVKRKKVTVDFDAASLSSDDGLFVLRAVERRPRPTKALVGCIRESRDPERVVHTLPAMLRLRWPSSGEATHKNRPASEALCSAMNR